MITPQLLKPGEIDLQISVNGNLLKCFVMNNEPKIEHRNSQPYVAIAKRVSMQEIPNVLPPLIPEIFSWIQQNNVEQDGPPFFHYRRLENNSMIEAEVGVPVKKPVSGDEKVKSGTFSEGDYATLTYYGPYSNLRSVHASLEKWIDTHGHKHKVETDNTGIQRGSRIESYPSPMGETNPEKLRTDIAVLVE